jgi:hypothetical protein
MAGARNWALGRRLAVRLASLAVGFALAVSVALPWFSLPLFGWAVPVPAWNGLGLGLLLLAGFHVLRALSFPGMAWAIRLMLPWAGYRWWGSEELFRHWGKHTFAPLQLRLSGLNQALSTVGADPVTVFDPVLWREVAPGLGWKLAGISLLLALVITALDLPVRSRCPSCRSRVGPDDRCCHGCGASFPDVPGCLGCGRRPHKGDGFCRSCGRSLVQTTQGPERA